jgi:RHS repeat-associated protein
MAHCCWRSKGVQSRRHTAVRAILAGLIVTLVTTIALGQGAARPDKGVRPTGSYAVSDIEHINMTNGNLGLSIPLASLPPVAGGKLGWTVGANYNSKMWDVIQHEDEDNSFVPPVRWMTSHLQAPALSSWSVGGRYFIEVTESHQDVDWRFPVCDFNEPPLYCDPDWQLMQQPQYQTWYKVSLTTPDGAVHELRPFIGGEYPSFTREYLLRYSWQTPLTTGNTMAYYSYDGSYLWATIQPFTGGFPSDWDVYLPDGTRIKNRGAVQRIIDTNGNQVKINVDVAGPVTTTFFRDLQTGREVRVVFDQSINQPFGQGRVEYQTVGGGWASILINYRSTYVNGWAYVVGDLYCPDTAELISNQDLAVVDTIVLPQTEPGVTRQFAFEYNSDSSVPANYQWKPSCSESYAISSMSKGLGSLSKMTTPTGAVVKYSYLQDQPDAGSPLTYPVDPTDLPGDALVKKEIQHDSAADVWNYAPGIQSGISTMTGPDGSNVTEKSFPHDRAFQYTHGGSDGKGGLTYRTAQKTGAGSEVSVVERKWRFNSLNNVPAGSTGSGQLVPFNPVVDIEFTTLMDPPGTPAKMSARQFQYDLNGNAISETDYDWFDPALANPYRDPQAGNVPTQVPPGVSVLRVTANTYYNGPGTDQNSPNIYHKRIDGDPPSPLILSAPRTSVVGPSQAEFYYDGSLDLNTVPLIGNLTKQRHWEGTTWLSITHTYDPLTGNLTSTTDPNNNVTQLFYDATQALPSSVVVDPLNGTGQQTTSTVYDFSTGLPTSVTDPNGRTTTSVYTNQLLGGVDAFNRPGVVTDAQGRTTVTRYRDNARQVEVWSDLNTPSDAKLRSRASADQLGRPIKTESAEDGLNYTIFADTVYQQMGKVTISTNPMRAQGASTDGWTRATRDDLGRVLTVETFSGIYPSGTATGTVTTSYNGNATTVTGQASKVRRSIVDGLGRLARVDEPNSAGSLGTVTAPNQPTNYTYDSRGNLTQVAQGGQTRLFVYDGLSRLKQAANPESDAVNYTYDDNGNLKTKTDARSVVTTFNYDGFNRVTSRTYSGPAPGGTTPAVTYVYDTLGAGLNGKGRLTSAGSSVSSYGYGSYDVMGRVVTGSQTTDGQNYTMSYQYNLAGAMTSETYPSGRVVVTEYDPAARIAGVKNQATGVYWAGATPTDATNRIQYSAHGAVSVMKLGNSKWEHTNYNSRLQPEQIGLGTSGADSSTLRLDYTYGTTNNNGNVQTQRIVIAGSLDVTQSYTYDELNRLKTANESSGANWSQTYGFDRWGNRWVSASSGYTLSSLTPTTGGAFNTGNNRMFAGGYDLAGNQTTDAQSRSFSYDAENRQITFNGSAGQYFYDGDGRRVKKIDSSGTTVFVYNAGGQLIAEYHSDPVPSPAGGGGTSYLTSDHLGSTRVVTKADGTVKARYDYLPFGDELGSGIGGRTVGMGYSAADSTNQKFTQKERDNESGLDYFLARYYSSAQGRFTSPDDIRNDSHVGDPQSWNRYAYVRNNPLHYIDPTGKDATVQITTDEEHKTGTITIQASFAIWTGKGSGLTDAQMQHAAAEIKQTIEAAWTGSLEKDGIKYDVKTEVSVIFAGSEKTAEKSAANAIELVNGSATSTMDSYVNPRSVFGGPDSGKWNINSLVDSVGAHEFTHLLGVRNRTSGAYLSNTNMLNDPRVPRHATADDFRWALGGAIDAHRWESRPNVITGNELETRSSPGFSRGAPVSYQSTRNVHAAFFRGN